MKNAKKMTTKVVAMLIAIIMVASMFPVAIFATEEDTLLTVEELREQYGAISIEAYNLGHGFLVEPSLYAKEGKSVGDITVDFLETNGLTYSVSTSYFSGMEFDDTVAPEYPAYLEPYLGELEESGNGDGMLSEFDYSQYAGWCFTINEWWASWGADSSYPGQEITDYNTGEQIVLGDVIRWHFTVYGYGADCGFPANVMAEFMGGNLFTQEDKSELIFILAAVNGYYGNLDTDDVYETALAVAANPLATADEIAEQEGTLLSYIKDTFFAAEEAPREAQDVSDVLKATMAHLAETVTEPAFGTNAGEWTVLCLARGEHFEAENEYFSDYYDRIVTYVNEKAASINQNGALHKSKSTDNSRVILALSAIGEDATSVGNWNLVAPFEDFNWIKKQGINGPIFALIALDTVGYATVDNTIREQCVDYILDAQFEDGGWALSGSTADPDVTAMALQALAPYKAQADVSTAAEEAFACLSTIQNQDGGYASWGTVNVESCAQVIVACTAWGINPDTDSNFVKNGKSVVDAVLAHYLEDKAAFEHVIDSGANDMATDQACYALVAYDRFINGKTALYDMSDVLGANYIGAQTQKYTENSSEYYAVRFLATVDEAVLNSKSVKFKITATCEKDGENFSVTHWDNKNVKKYEIDVTTVYKSIYEGTEQRSAAELKYSNDDYICAVAIKKIAADTFKDVNITFTVQTYVETAFGTKLISEAQSITVCNGAEVK